MIRCPACQGTHIRIHATHYEGWWGYKRWLFGPMVPKIRTVGLDCSCATCLYAFVSTPDGSRAAPIQTAHDTLRAAQQALADQGKGRNATGEADKAQRPPNRTPGPAPDPRVRKR